MQLELNKKYYTEDGSIVVITGIRNSPISNGLWYEGKMVKNMGSTFVFTWRKNGFFYSDNSFHNLNIISEFDLETKPNSQTGVI